MGRMGPRGPEPPQTWQAVYVAREMERLEAPFTAGLLAWVQCGPSYQPRLSDGQMKISVLLGRHAAGWRFSRQHPWLRVPARSTSVCVGDVPAGAELTGGGHFCMLILEREYLGKRWAVASTEERRRYDVAATHDPFLFHLMAEASARLRREQRLAPGYVESLAHLASVHVRERYLQERPPAVQRPPVFLAPHAEARVRAHIQTHLGEKLPLADLAAVAGVSTSHFAKAFHRSVGETPHRFLVRQRLEHARGLLRAAGGAMHLAEAAFQARFSSQSHFTRSYRSWYGLTPGEFLHQERPGGTRT